MIGNNVTLVGTLLHTPELRYTYSGDKPVTNLKLEVSNSRWNKQTRQREETVSVFGVTCWHELAENVADSLFEGDRVVVVGHMEQDRWEDKEGNRRNGLHIVASEVAASLKFSVINIQQGQTRDRRNNNY